MAYKNGLVITTKDEFDNKLIEAAIAENEVLKLKLIVKQPIQRNPKLMIYNIMDMEEEYVLEAL